MANVSLLSYRVYSSPTARYSEERTMRRCNKKVDVVFSEGMMAEDAIIDRVNRGMYVDALALHAGWRASLLF